MKLECIVVGVDGSANAAGALDWAIGLARSSGARVVAVHALGLMDRIGSERVPTATHRDAIIAEFHDRWCAALDGGDVVNDRMPVDGPPADAILATARDVAADLVVVGERGLGDAPQRMLGSTSRRVLADANCPVLVIPEHHDD